MLLGRSVQISQLGAQVPVTFTFAIAPVVFLFLHIYTLIRYDMLSANLRQFRAELQNMVPIEADRERCRQLLANVEFVQWLVAPKASPLHSVFFGLVARLVIAVFPVTVLLLVQISSLPTSRVEVGSEGETPGVAVMTQVGETVGVGQFQ